MDTTVMPTFTAASPVRNNKDSPLFQSVWMEFTDTHLFLKKYYFTGSLFLNFITFFKGEIVDKRSTHTPIDNHM